jgi:limonene-1,2-epoxide hydrolase
MTSNSDRVRAFIAAWERRDVGAIVGAMTPTACYHNIPMREVRGRDAIRAAIEPFLSSATAVRWELRAIAEAADGTVLTERLDVFEFGAKTIAIPVMGAFELEDNLISHWRDYFDLGAFQRQMA